MGLSALFLVHPADPALVKAKELKVEILWMEEILNHLGWLKPYE